MPSRRDMSRSDKTKRPRMRLSPSDKSALQRAYALIGPDAADNRYLMAPTLEGDEPDTGTEPDPNARGPEIQNGFIFDDGTEMVQLRKPAIQCGECGAQSSREIREAEDKYYYRVGQQLTAIHPKFEHGQWKVWVGLEVGISPQNSRNYMVFFGFGQIYGVDVARLFRQALFTARQRARTSHAAADATGESWRAHHCLGRSAGRTYAYQPPRPALNDSGDDQGQGSDRTGRAATSKGRSVTLTPMGNWTRRPALPSIACTTSPSISLINWLPFCQTIRCALVPKASACPHHRSVAVPGGSGTS